MRQMGCHALASKQRIIFWGNVTRNTCTGMLDPFTVLRSSSFVVVVKFHRPCLLTLTEMSIVIS